jgi:DNA-binding transcriptional MocR family regulator
MGFTGLDEGKIDEGLRRLGQVIRAQMSEAAGTIGLA